MVNVRLPVTKRLEIALLVAGLVGIFLTWSGLFLPWGWVEWGKNGDVLIAFNGFRLVGFGLGKAGMINPLVILPLLASVPCYIFLLIQRDSKGASLILAAAGLCIMLQTLMWMAGVFLVPGVSYTHYPLYIINVGVYTTIIGSLFTLLAGLLSLLRIKLMPPHPIVTKRKLETYLVDRFLMFALRLIALTLVVFWLYSFLSPWGREYLLGQFNVKGAGPSPWWEIPLMIAVGIFFVVVLVESSRRLRTYLSKRVKGEKS